MHLEFRGSLQNICVLFGEVGQRPVQTASHPLRPNYEGKIVPLDILRPKTPQIFCEEGGCEGVRAVYRFAARLQAVCSELSQHRLPRFSRIDPYQTVGKLSRSSGLMTPTPGVFRTCV